MSTPTQPNNSKSLSRGLACPRWGVYAAAGYTHSKGYPPDRCYEEGAGAGAGGAEVAQVNVYASGFVVHPDAHHLGDSPDGRVVDPTEIPLFGLIEVKCPNAQTTFEATHIKVVGGKPQLKRGHKYRTQVQGGDWPQVVWLSPTQLVTSRSEDLAWWSFHHCNKKTIRCVLF